MQWAKLTGNNSVATAWAILTGNNSVATCMGNINWK